MAEDNLRKLREERDRFVGFAFANADALIEVDQDLKVAYAAGAVQWLTGERPEALLHQSLLDLVARKSQPMARALMLDPSAPERFGPVSIQLRQRSGKTQEIALSGTHLPGQGHVYLALNAQRLAPLPGPETTENRDQDTGLLTKEEFADRATEALKSPPPGGSSYVMTFLDLDGMGDLTNRVGGTGAEAFMDDIAAHLQAHSVGGDSASHVGGDRYGLVHDASLDVPALERVLVDRTQEFDPEHKGIEVTASTVRLEADPAVEAEDSARALLYAINRFSDERESFTISDLSQGYRLMLDETVERIGAFRNTLSAEQYHVVYQPIVDLRTRAPHHHEALVRLNETERYRSPFHFITFAEEVNMIGEFDLAMTEKVVAKIREGQRNNDVLRIAVNLSGRSLESQSFVDSLHALLRRHREVGDQLMFEVTESAKISRLEETNAVIQGLRAAGHHVCLDDFGSGAAAFQYLRALEVDFVKIDGVYVREALTTPNGMAFLRAMAGLCRDIGIQTVAEMVETEEEVGFLIDANVQYGQGYYFGKPAPGVTGIRDAPRPRPAPQHRSARHPGRA